MTLVLILVIIVVVAAAFAGGALWQRRQAELAAERQAEAELEEELDDALAAGGRAVRMALQTAARIRDEGFGAAVRGSLEEMVGWAEEEKPDLRRMAADDGTVTLFFSDIENSTALNEQLGDRAWLKVLGAHDKIVRGRVERHDGHIVKSQGDGFMVVFAEPHEALRCAVEVQQSLESGGRRLRRNPIRVRIGIHRGEAVAKDGDFFGRNVAFAARVAGQAEGGEILVSSEVAEAVEGEGQVDFVRPRDVELKGLPGEHRLLAVDWQPA
jgi:class 3 adenylate cyclase